MLYRLRLTTFYANIPPIRDIRQIADPNIYVDVPSDWHIALTDVQGSTKAIEAGRYKEVNALAAASITALLNAFQRADIPFVFGGDGATVLFPPEYLEKARETLLATSELGRSQFDLDLRIAIIPIQALLDKGLRIAVAKLVVSEDFEQALLSGGGLAEAERMFKDPEEGKLFQVRSSGPSNYQADFSGFECRWNAVPSSRDETVSLIVQALRSSAAERNKLYHDVLQNIERLYGDKTKRRPVTVEHLRLALAPRGLRTEAKIRFRNANFRRLLTLLLSTIIGHVAITLGIGRWKEYRRKVSEAIDNEKFDDTLRMIISGTARERDALVAYLEAHRRTKDLVFGIHISSEVLVTCLVFDRFGRQVHFVDGAGGGYALAAKMMKQQLAEL